MQEMYVDIEWWVSIQVVAEKHTTKTAICQKQVRAADNAENGKCKEYL